MYWIDGHSISEFGAIPRPEGQALALEGTFDLPKRKGDTEVSWGTSIEPLVEAQDIKMEGRELKLHLWLKAESEAQYDANITALRNALIACREIRSDCSTHTVLLKGEVEVEEYRRSLLAIVHAPLWEPEVSITTPLSLAKTPGGSFAIDGWGLRDDFGVIVSAVDAARGIAPRIEIGTTDTYLNTSYRDNRSIKLSCCMIGNSPADIYIRMCNLQGVLMTQGLRSITIPGTGTLEGYVVDGFTATAKHRRCVCFDLKIKVV